MIIYVLLQKWDFEFNISFMVDVPMGQILEASLLSIVQDCPRRKCCRIHSSRSATGVLSGNGGRIDPAAV